MPTLQIERRLDSANRSGLARELGLTRSYVSQVLNGQRDPGLRVAKKVADRLGLTIDQLAIGLERKNLLNESEKVN